MNTYLILGVAIVVEVIAMTFLKASDGFTRLWPSIATVVGYGISFYALSITMKTIPTGVAYAIWSGVGIVLVSLLSLLFYKQRLDTPAMVGMGLIIAGVVVINLFSKTQAH
jgi:small multidrug resistance pump